MIKATITDTRAIGLVESENDKARLTANPEMIAGHLIGTFRVIELSSE